MDHSGANRRWRGTLDVPLTRNGHTGAVWLALDFPEPFDLVIHDDLSRCRDTARTIASHKYLQNSTGPRPWNMGPSFEGMTVDDVSIKCAQLYIEWDIQPPAGERFSEWEEDWSNFIEVMNYSYSKDRVAVVTHNRNIQYLYSRRSCGCFSRKLYDVVGPGFLTVHYYKDGYIAPWTENNFPPGLYLIRHGETVWGT